jgi:hypothetical protein
MNACARSPEGAHSQARGLSVRMSDGPHSCSGARAHVLKAQRQRAAAHEQICTEPGAPYCPRVDRATSRARVGPAVMRRAGLPDLFSASVGDTTTQILQENEKRSLPRKVVADTSKSAKK